MGAIAGAYGLRGEVRLKSFCSNVEDIAAYGPLHSENGAQTFTISLGKPIKGALSARLSGVTSKEAADALRGTRLFVDRDQLPALPDEDEYYYSDLIGMVVLDAGGVPIGRVRDVQNHGATDLLEISLDQKGELVLIPFTKETVPTVNLALGRIVIDPPEGLFP